MESDEAPLLSPDIRATSMADQHDASHANRLMDMAFEDGEVRGPLAGFFPATLRVPTLEQALAPLAADYPHLHAVTGRSVKLARKKAKKAQLKYPSLTMDECTAIVLYTMEEEPRETSLYYVMNAALRSKQRAEVRPWRDFIWLLLHALRKLPVAALPVVFRGCTKAPSELGLELEAGFEFSWAGFSSTATTQGVMSTFVGQAGPRTLLTIVLSEPVGRDVQDFSLFPKENEVLFPPNMCFEVVSHFDSGGGLIMVQCKQTETIDAILDMTPPAAASTLPPPDPGEPHPTEEEQMAWALQQSTLVVPVAASTEAEMAAFFANVGVSREQVRSATQLDWSSKQLTAGDCKVIAHLIAAKFMPVLTTLGLADNEIGYSGAKAIAEALKVNAVLTELLLGGNSIGNDGAKAIAEALKVNPVLTTLNLWGNRIGVEGAKAIAEALKVNPVLNTLWLSNNNIGVDGAKAIAEALKVNPVLTKLDQSTSSTTIWEMQGKKRCETR